MISRNMSEIVFGRMFHFSKYICVHYTMLYKKVTFIFRDKTLKIKLI